MRAALLIALLAVGCSPIQRYAVRRCPTQVTLLADFVSGTTALAISVLAFNNGRNTRSFTYAALGMGFYLGANHAECRR